MKYDLEERTLKFARTVRSLARLLPRTIGNTEDVRQVIRSSGSVGANYREANGALGRKDFIMRLRIARKEAKETSYWLQLVDTSSDEQLENQRAELLREASELVSILGAILRKATNESQSS
jgi:four helix bundle protein